MNTDFKTKWEAFKKSPQFVNCIDSMEAKGIVAPYNENILHTVFSAGYRAQDEPKEIKVKHFKYVAEGVEFINKEKVKVEAVCTSDRFGEGCYVFYMGK